MASRLQRDNDQVAEEPSISDDTVKTISKRILSKLYRRDRVQAVVIGHAAVLINE